MEISRRRAMRHLGLGLAGASLAGLGVGRALAQQDFPARPVRMVMPYAAGGTGDVVARAIAERLSRTWGKPVVVDNRPGAGGMIGADAVARSEPDGYTLLMALTGLVQAPSLYRKAAFNPVTDFAPISELATSHIALVVQPSLNIKSLRELIAHFGRQDRPLPYGSYGLGSSGHLQMEIFGRVAKLPLVHVPYKGEGPLVNDLLGGQVPAGVVGAATARTHSAAGKLRVLAVAGSDRSPLLPDTPTFRQEGFAGLERQGWIGLLAPAGTPRPLVEKISADVNRVLESADLRARMTDIGVLLKGSSPTAFAGVVKAEQVYWADAIRAADIHLD